MESTGTKIPRKRVANFTADEIALLANRIRHLEYKKKMETQILKTQLEVEQIKKRAALLEEEKNNCLLEKAKIELEELKKSIAK